MPSSPLSPHRLATGRRRAAPVVRLLTAALFAGASLSADESGGDEEAPPAPDGRAVEEEGPGAAVPPPAERPAYRGRRFNEDWTRIGEVEDEGDIFDPIKDIPLGTPEVRASFGGQARLRYEGWSDFGFAPANDGAFLLSRLRAHADVRATRWLRGYIEGRSALSTDRDLPGGRRPIDESALDLLNGFVDVRLPAGDAAKLTVRSGRQELKFGRQRLVSPLDWANTRRTFEGFSGIFEAGDLQVTGFYTQLVRPRKYDFDQADAQTEFFGVYATDELPCLSLDADLYFLGLLQDAAAVGAGYNGTLGPEDRFTVGARIGGPIAETGFDFDLESAGQFGEVGAGDVGAAMVAVELGYRVDLKDRLPGVGDPRFHVGIDWASGDDRPGGDVETFNQLFPLGHAWLGFIDAVGRQNVLDVRTGLSVKVVDRLQARLDGHTFFRADSADALYNAGGAVVRPGAAGSSRLVGSEIDLLLGWTFDRHLKASVGYSHFFAGDFISESGPDADIDFAYVVAQYTF